VDTKGIGETLALDKTPTILNMALR